jgi:hypothetical protein
VILPEEDHAKWLGEAEGGDLKALLKPLSSRSYAGLDNQPESEFTTEQPPWNHPSDARNIGDWELDGP